MKRFTLFLFYFFLTLLPTQLGRHFFFDFSLISGIRSDYLAPTVYLTDVIVFLMVILEILHDKIPNPKHQVTNKHQWIFIFFYLLFNSLFIATNKWAALYKLVKIAEFFLLGWVIVRIRPKLQSIILVLSVGVFYSSVIAIWQFVIQKSIGGLFWFLGERTFYASTVGIAAFSLGGRLILRPYATFPHPNVLGGFLAVVLPLFLYSIIKASAEFKMKRFWFVFVLLLGIVTLFLTFSRAAWIGGGIGFLLVLLNNKYKLMNWLKKNRNFVLIIFYLLLILSVLTPLILRNFPDLYQQNIRERVDLINGALKMLSLKPFFGYGLNNFIVQYKSFIPLVKDMYVFQPVHNIYLLILVETGLTGLFIFLIALSAVFYKSLKISSLITLSLIQIIFLGFFDHYFFTLQQGQLLFTLFTALALLNRKGVN